MASTMLEALQMAGLVDAVPEDLAVVEEPDQTYARLANLPEEVRVYLAESASWQDISAIEKDAERKVTDMGYEEIGWNKDVSSIEYIVPGRGDRRRWVKIGCRNSFIAQHIYGCLVECGIWSPSIERFTVPVRR